MNTYTKLSDGSWGVKTDSRVTPGMKITVTKKSGEKKTETVTGIVKSLPVGMIVNIAASAKPSRNYGGVCADCEFNQDAGDMMGCPKHRGNPRC